MSRLTIIKLNLSIRLLIISFAVWTVFFFLGTFYYPMDVYLFPFYFILIAFLVSSPIWIVWFVILIIKLKSSKRLRIALSIWLGLIISLIPSKYMMNYSDKNWRQAGIITEKAIETYHDYYGLYPKQLTEVPDSIFVFNNNLTSRYSKQILYYRNDKNDNMYNHLPDSLNYLLSRHANIFDKFEWDNVSKEWEYIDF